MLIYKKYTSSIGLEFIKATKEDGQSIHFPIDPANSDYQAYLKSLEDEANTL